MAEKKNKIHNPQFVTDAAPSTVQSEDIGRIWFDKTNHAIKLAITNKDTGNPELRNLLDSNNLVDIDNQYFKGTTEEYVNIVAQEAGDKHYDNGYDFFSDPIFIQHSTQETDDYYSYFYKEVPDTSSPGYARTISTDVGVKHVRPAYGSDTYQYNSTTYNLTNYSKIILTTPVKEIIDISFANKDILAAGFELLADKKTILIYADPDGFFINQTVKVKSLI